LPAAAFGALDLAPLYARRNGRNRLHRHLILKGEHVLERTLEAVYPAWAPLARYDQLCRDARMLPALRRSFKHIAYAKLATDLADIRRFALVGKLELRAMTKSDLKRDRAVMISLERRRQSIPARDRSLMFWKGSTAMEACRATAAAPAVQSRARQSPGCYRLLPNRRLPLHA